MNIIIDAIRTQEILDLKVADKAGGYAKIARLRIQSASVSDGERATRWTHTSTETAFDPNSLHSLQFEAEADHIGDHIALLADYFYRDKPFACLLAGKEGAISGCFFIINFGRSETFGKTEFTITMHSAGPVGTLPAKP